MTTSEDRVSQIEGALPYPATKEDLAALEARMLTALATTQADLNRRIASLFWEVTGIGAACWPWLPSFGAPYERL